MTELLPPVAGWVGFGILAIGFLRYAGEWFLNRRKAKDDHQGAPVRDAATANAALVDTVKELQSQLRDERAESRMKDARIDELEEARDKLRTQLREATDTAAEKIRSLQVQLAALMDEVASMRQRFELGDEQQTGP